MKFGKNEYGETLEISVESHVKHYMIQDGVLIIHIGRNSKIIAADILTAMTLRIPWVVQIRDYNCESHFVTLDFSPGCIKGTLHMEYEGHDYGFISREIVEGACKNRLEAEFYAMGV